MFRSTMSFHSWTTCHLSSMVSSSPWMSYMHGIVSQEMTLLCPPWPDHGDSKDCLYQMWSLAIFLYDMMLASGCPDRRIHLSQDLKIGDHRTLLNGIGLMKRCWPWSCLTRAVTYWHLCALTLPSKFCILSMTNITKPLWSDHCCGYLPRLF